MLFDDAHPHYSRRESEFAREKGKYGTPYWPQILRSFGNRAYTSISSTHNALHDDHV